MSADDTAAEHTGDKNPDAADDRSSVDPPRGPRFNPALILATVVVGLVAGTAIWMRARIDPPRLQPSGESATDDVAAKVDQQIATALAAATGRLHISEFEINDAQLQSVIDKLDFVDTLILDRGRITDAAMPDVAGLPKLQHLRLRLSPISDAGMEQLSQCATLLVLNLPHANLTADGVRHLAAIPKLRQLRLGSPGVGSEITREIAKLTTLRSVHLIGIAVTDEGLKTLAMMPQLESLYLDDAAVTEAGWDWLFDNHPYLHVHIDQSHHDRDPNAHSHHE